MVKRGKKGKGASPNKGAGKGRTTYKTDLCSFFERGCCDKGSACSFAHGMEDLQGGQGNHNSGANLRPDSDVMSWLKEQREQGGQAGLEFEAKWKEWCKSHNLKNIPRSERIQSIHDFRAHVASSPQDEFPSDANMSASGHADLRPTCLKGHELKERVCGPEDYECDNCKADIREGERFYDCGECDYSHCCACYKKRIAALTDSKGKKGNAARVATKQGGLEENANHVISQHKAPEVRHDPQAKCSELEQRKAAQETKNEFGKQGTPTEKEHSQAIKQNEKHAVQHEPPAKSRETAKQKKKTVEASNTLEVSQELPAKQDGPTMPNTNRLWNSSIELVRTKLLAAIEDRHVKQALRPDWVPGSAWQRLASQAACHADKCEARCAEIAGSFLNSEGVGTLAKTCMGRRTMSAVSCTLRLQELLKDSEIRVQTEEQQSLLAAACVAELFNEICETTNPSPRLKAAAAALIDFICLVGLSHFVAEGVVQAFAPGASDAGTAQRDEPAKRGNDLSKASQADVPECRRAENTAEGDAGEDARGERGNTQASQPSHVEDEDSMRTRRIQAQEQRKSTLQWDYTGGYRPTEHQNKNESNEEAMLRMINSRAKPSLQRPATNAVPSGRGTDPGTRKFKRQICTFWEQGKCEKGRDCTFAHGVDDIEVRNSGSVGAGDANLLESRNYKRNLCTYFAQGRCDKGDKCSFAHGRWELDAKSTRVHQGPSWERGPS
eukprot:TRINITY_DN4908_c0_g2_i1.p1 TRINITY_DN4908_c0_g2~~TRINITY_DN4908_c0_g2_i1.p1  ORF type:complete len:724 (+),score=114.81 TRINITY_DN4908_c0_g2_i1:53-2224(+)